MNVELVLNEETLIRNLEPEIDVHETKMTEIKEVKVNTQGSVEGIALEVKLIGASKHQFCTIRSEEGHQISIKYWENNEVENVRIQEGLFVKFENITFQYYENALCGNTRALTVVTVDEEKSMKTVEELYQAVNESHTIDMSMANDEENGDNVEDVKRSIEEDLIKKKGKLEELDTLISDCVQKKKRIELKIRRLKKELANL